MRSQSAARREYSAKAAPSSSTSTPANGRISQAPKIANPMPMASAAIDSAANTVSSPAGDIEQLRLSVRLNPPSASRNANSRRGGSSFGVLTGRAKVPQINDLSQEWRREPERN